MTAFVFELDCAFAAVALAYEPYYDLYGCDVIRHVTRLLFVRVVVVVVVFVVDLEKLSLGVDKL